jgi:hypothetical protein
MMVRTCLLLVATASVAGQRPAAKVGPDNSFFAAVVRGIPAVNVWGEMSVVVDPAVADGGMMGPMSTTPSPIDTAGWRARSATLERLGVASADDIDLHGCPGYFVADSADARCPLTRSTRIAIGLPRPVVGGRVPDPPHNAATPIPADAVVRLVFAYLTPSGSAMREADYYLRHDASGWWVVARRTLTVSH